MNSRKPEPARPVDRPESGFFRVRLVRKGPFVPARIHHQDGLWFAHINGDNFAAHEDPASAPEVFRIWLSGERISEDEYNYLCATRIWAAQYDPPNPVNSPKKPIDLAALPPLF